MYRFDSRVRYSEVDSEGRLSLESLLDYFQDCSTFQSEDLGIGVAYLAKRKLAWVLSAWQIVVGRYPGLGERVSVGTEPYELKGFVGYRNFLMDGEGGERLAWGNSVWTLVDMESARPVKATERMQEAYGLGERLDMDYAPRKIALPQGEGSRREAVEIKRHHLDTNRHVNNGQYVRLAMEYLEEGRFVRQMRAEYKKQALLGERLYPVVYRGDGVTAVSLEQADGKPYCVVEFMQDERQGGDVCDSVR